MPRLRFVLLTLVAASSTPYQVKSQLGEALQANMKSGEAKLAEQEAGADGQMKRMQKKVEDREKDLGHLGLHRPTSWLETGEREQLTKPTSLLEADARVAAGMADLDKALRFDELDAEQPSSLLEIPGLAQQQERFQAARQKLLMVKDSIAEDSRKMKDNSRRATAALLEEPSSLLETRKQKMLQTSLSHSSMGVQQWAAAIAAKQNNFIRKLANHGMKIPRRLRDAMEADKAMSLVETKPSVVDQIPVTHMTSSMVDAKMKSLEHRLRHDAQIFQEEADSGRRPILAGSSFLQTGEAEPDDDDDDDSPVKRSYNEMLQFRKDVRRDRATLQRDDEQFVEGAKQAKAHLADFEREHPLQQAFRHSSLLETEPHGLNQSRPLPDLQKVDGELEQLASQLHGEAARWKSHARHAHRAEEEERVVFDAAMHRGSHPASFLQRDELESAEVGMEGLSDWKHHIDVNAEERALSHGQLEKELSFKASEFGPELLAQHDRGGATSLLQTGGDPDPSLLREHLEQIEEHARDHHADMAGDDAELVPATHLLETDSPDDFHGVRTPGVITEPADATDNALQPDAAADDASKSDEQVVKAEEKAAEDAETAEKAEEKADEKVAEETAAAAQKDDDQLRKQ